MTYTESPCLRSFVICYAAQSICALAFRFRRSVMPTPEELLAASMRSMQSPGELNSFSVFHTFGSSLAFVEIMSWTAGVVSYAYLGLNRCVAICFYGTKARGFNRVSIAIIASISTWIVGVAAACAGTFPYILEDSRLDLWPISFYTATSDRPGMKLSSFCSYRPIIQHLLLSSSCW